jgi:hypothetical protein
MNEYSRQLAIELAEMHLGTYIELDNWDTALNFVLTEFLEVVRDGENG